jgi:anti-sigma factor RsiW
MNCDHFHLSLDGLLRDRLDDSAREEMLAHLQACEECATVYALCRREDSLSAPFLVESVLGQTTGSICSSIEERLGDWIDGRLEMDRSRELSVHVENCERCAELVQAMRRCDDLLPSFAEMEPDANFTADVLMATLEAASLWHVAWRRLRDLFERIFRRPAFPMEVSFATTVALVILTATPLAPWPQLPAQALAVVQSLGEQTAELDPAGASWNTLVESRAAEAMGQTSAAANLALRGRWERLRPRLDRVGGDVQRLGDSAIHLDFDAWLPAAQALGEDVRALWQSPATTPDPDGDAVSTEENPA